MNSKDLNFTFGDWYVNSSRRLQGRENLQTIMEGVNITKRRGKLKTSLRNKNDVLYCIYTGDIYGNKYKQISVTSSFYLFIDFVIALLSKGLCVYSRVNTLAGNSQIPEDNLNAFIQDFNNTSIHTRDLITNLKGVYTFDVIEDTIIL